jgi:exoribonuclease R
VAASLFGARTGLFRVMDPPDQRAVARLRHTARAFGVSWAEGRDLAEFERGLSPADPKQAAMMLAIRRSGGHARYEAFTPAHAPWHEAVAAAYAHATAPLRRLADRYVVMAALAVATNEPVPPTSADAFSRLPPVMGDADALGSQIDRAVVDLAEAVMMADRIGSSFAAVVTDVDERGARIQLSDLPVVGRVPAHRVQPGDPLTVVVTAADARTRTVSFTRAG